jgi:hypothetical protein
LYECQTWFGDPVRTGIRDQSAEKNTGTPERWKKLHVHTEEIRWSPNTEKSNTTMGRGCTVYTAIVVVYI